MRATCLLGLLLWPASALGDPPPAERWSVGPSAGVEAQADSQGKALSAMGLFGLAGTVRLQRFVCVDARLGFGGQEDGSETTRVEETRLRLDLRGAFCPALHRHFTLLLGAGPAVGVSLLRATAGGARTSYTANDLGASVDAGVLVRLAFVAVRLDLEAALLGRLTLGAFGSLGVAF